jgi:hypothetical protein
MRHFRNFTLLFFLLFLYGCAANIKEEVHKPLSSDGNNAIEQIYLDISHPKHVPTSTDLAKITTELKQLISGKYSGMTQDSSLSQLKPDNGIGVYISIEHLKYVSGVERFMVGILAGDAELRLGVKLVELSSGDVIGESVLDTRSKKVEGIFGATTSRQLEAVAQKIVEDIQSSNTKG